MNEQTLWPKRPFDQDLHYFKSGLLILLSHFDETSWICPFSCALENE